MDFLKSIMFGFIRFIVSLVISCIFVESIWGTGPEHADLRIFFTLLIFLLLSIFRRKNREKFFNSKLYTISQRIFSLLMDALFYTQRKEGKKILYDYCEKNLEGNSEKGGLFDLYSQVNKSNKLYLYEIRNFLEKTLDGLVEKKLHNSVPANTMFINFQNMCSGFGPFRFSNIRQKLNKCYIEEALLDGKLPVFYGDIDNFNLLKDEKPVYQIHYVLLYNWKNKKYYEGASSGYSVRIVKGFWLRQGSYKGRPIEYKELEYVDIGTLLITNKHLYYSGAHEIFRVPFEKIITINPSSNGLTIQRDGVSSKPMIFKFDDTLFVYEIIKLLSKDDYSNQ